MQRDIARYLLKARSTITARHDPPEHAREGSRLRCSFHQTCHLTCEHALRGKGAFWKAPRSCCGTSTRIRTDWKCPALPLLLKPLEILGRAKATMPSRRADLELNQKSAGRKNQNKPPCPAPKRRMVIKRQRAGDSVTSVAARGDQDPQGRTCG